MPFSDRILSTIEDMTEEASLARHPFMQDWQNGELTRDELRSFATQYYQQVAAFPRYLSTVHAGCRDEKVRRELLEVLASVEMRPPTSSDLWLQTCAALGLFSDSVRDAEYGPHTQACINDFFFLCSNGTVSGIAAMYAYVRQIPSLCRVLREGLVEHYGMNGGPGLEYFDACGYAAGGHVETLRNLLGTVITSEDANREAISATESALTALTGLFSGATAMAAAR